MSSYTMLIADDEEIERKALSLLVSKEFPDINLVAMAENGMELITMVQKYHPDMAIVDVNMPGINGIDAIDLLCSKGCKTHFIINTAYDEFNYAQKALALKIDAYILKPEKRDTTIRTIQKLCTQIDKNRENIHSQQQIQTLFTQVHNMLESEIMYSLFIREPACEDFDIYCEMHALRFRFGAVAVLLPQPGITFAHLDKADLRTALDRSLSESCSYISAITEANICLMLFIEEQDPLQQRRWVYDVLRVALDKINRAVHFSLRAGVGGIYPRFRDLHRSYQESLLAAMEQKEENISFYQPDCTDDSDPTDILAGLMRSGNMQQMNLEIARVLAKSQNHPQGIQTLWTRLEEKFSLDRARPEIDSQIRTVDRQLAETASTSAATEIILNGIYQLSVLLSRRNSSPDSIYIEKCLQYIGEHFTEDISLEGVAEQISISPSYLSRQFKSECGVTFVEYLTSLRMKEAVRLATETCLPIQEIAKRTGYSGATYFCRVFKKQIGCTIGELREQQRKKHF